MYLLDETNSEGFDLELVSVEDIFEDDTVVLMKTKYEFDEGYVLATDIGTKNNHGDIVEITTLKYKVIYEAYL